MKPICIFDGTQNEEKTEVLNWKNYPMNKITYVHIDQIRNIDWADFADYKISKETLSAHFHHNGIFFKAYLVYTTEE